jgi:hypothetical protein
MRWIPPVRSPVHGDRTLNGGRDVRVPAIASLDEIARGR